MPPVNSLRILALLVIVGLNGCAQISVEDQAILSFTSALQSQDLGDLRAMTSETFQEKALRHTESLDDLKILRLPTDVPTVAKIEDVSPTEKNITVSPEGSARRLLYRLVLTDGQWVVDDIYMKQKQKGLKVTRSVTEQMDLLLSVREFLTVWDEGNRTDVVATTTPEFADILNELPPSTLANLTEQVTSGRSDRTAFRPEAQLDNDRAVVKLPRTNGELLISFNLLNEEWKVDDVGVISKAKGAANASVRRQAEILSSGLSFLNAYKRSDKNELGNLCTAKFYRGSLLPSDLTLQPLPAGDHLGPDLEIRSHDKQATIIVPHLDDVVKIDLVRDDELDDETAKGGYRVDDVTLFQTDGSQQRRLSSVFTSRARLLIFHNALQRQDLSLIRRMATNDFNERVWNQIDEELIQQLPLESIQAGFDTIEAAEFLGSVTRLTTKVGDETIVWILKDTNGKMTVDDIMQKSTIAPDSLKSRFEILVPAIRFAMKLHQGKVDQLVSVCSNDFNRLVWKHTQTVPHVEAPVARLLTSPLTKVQRQASRGQVALGSESYGAKIQMVEEHGHWVVDEVNLTTGLDTAQRSQLKHTYRHQLAVNSRRSSRSGNATAVAQLPDSKPIAKHLVSSAPAPTSKSRSALAATPARPKTVRTIDRQVVPAAFEFESDTAESNRVIHANHELPATNSSVDRVVDPSENPIAIPF